MDILVKGIKLGLFNPLASTLHHKSNRSTDYTIKLLLAFKNPVPILFSPQLEKGFWGKGGLLKSK